MKKLVAAFLLFAFVNIFSTCNNDDNILTSPTAVNNTIISGTWRITYYYDSDHEETSNYAGYTFTFSGNNLITAVNGNSSISGTWNTLNDDSKVKLVLNFASPASFQEISDDWHVIERTDTRIKLEDVSGGNGGTDYLTFQKN